MLKRLRLKAGETLLIHGAAGGVGTFAVQLAVARGVTVIGTASERNHDYLRSIGATPVTYGDGPAWHGSARSLRRASMRSSTPPAAVSQDADTHADHCSDNHLPCEAGDR